MWVTGGRQGWLTTWPAGLWGPIPSSGENKRLEVPALVEPGPGGPRVVEASGEQEGGAVAQAAAG